MMPFTLLAQVLMTTLTTFSSMSHPLPYMTLSLSYKPIFLEMRNNTFRFVGSCQKYLSRDTFQAFWSYLQDHALKENQNSKRLSTRKNKWGDDEMQAYTLGALV